MWCGDIAFLCEHPLPSLSHFVTNLGSPPFPDDLIFKWPLDGKYSKGFTSIINLLGTFIFRLSFVTNGEFN